MARRKNIMSTAMKNILTIAVVTPSFYYFGWYIYGCFEHGGPAAGPCGPTEFAAASAAPRRRGPTRWVRTSATTSASSSSSPSCSSPGRPASIMSGALIERVRLSAYLLLAVLLGSAVWIMDAAWGWSAGRLADDEVRLPRLDRVGRRARRRRSVHARRAAQPRAANRQVRLGRERSRAFRPHNTHLTLIGADADLHGLLRLLRRVPGDPVDDLPRLAQHLPLADDARRRSRW